MNKKNKCVDCGKKLKDHRSKRCPSCAKKGRNNPMFGIKGAAHPTFKGGSKYYKERKAEYDKKYCRKNKTKKSCYDKRYYKKNKQKINKRNRIYAIAHRQNIAVYEKFKRHTDIQYRLANNLRCRVKQAIKNNWKHGSTIELLDCSINKLKQYLKNKFTKGMTWKTYGKYWEIDHIKPCCSFDLSKASEQKKCFNHKNLQPLTITENRSKGSKYKNK